jgi:hypothetical protein
MEKDFPEQSGGSNFAGRLKYELKRAERYRIFVSFLVFDIGSILEKVGDLSAAGEQIQKGFVNSVKSIIRHSVREVDAVSNGSGIRIGVLCPETARQGAEAAARRIQTVLGSYCADHFKSSKDYVIPVEIASFPDAAGNRSIASYFDEYVNIYD